MSELSEQEQMDAVLDNLGVVDDVAPNEPIIEEEEQEIIEEDDNQEELNADRPPGYVSYEEWVADGKDPDDWQGKNKYSQQYDLIQDNKEFKTELKELTGLMRSTVEATKDMQEQSYQRGLSEAQDNLNKAIDDGDVEAVIKAKDELTALNKQPRAQQPQVNPIHQQFFDANAVLDINSSQHDPEFKQEFARIYDGKLRADGVTQDQQLSDRAMKGYMNQAMKSAKALFPEKFESPRNSRQNNQPVARRTISKQSSHDQMSKIKITTKNPRDNSAYQDTYDTILNMKGGGKEAAEAFAKRMMN